MRPIGKGYYTYPDLLNGTMDLEAIARCNDAIDLEGENERRVNEAITRKNK